MTIEAATRIPESSIDFAGMHGAQPMKTPEKVANSLRVCEFDSIPGVEVDFVVEDENKTFICDENVGLATEPSEVVKDWLENRDAQVEERNGKVLGHFVTPCDVRLENPPLFAVRDCHFVVTQYPVSAES